MSSLCAANSVSGCVNCNTADLFCCPSSPGRLAIMALPDWTQVFAKTLALRPELLLQLHNATSLDSNSNGTDHSGDCSPPDVVEARRSWMLKDMDQQCQRHKPHVCSEHVRITQCYELFELYYWLELYKLCYK